MTTDNTSSSGSLSRLPDLCKFHMDYDFDEHRSIRILVEMAKERIEFLTWAAAFESPLKAERERDKQILETYVEWAEKKGVV